MRDKEVEKKLRLLTLQLESWKKLHDFITYGLDKAQPIISADQERQFTELRGALIQETEYVLTTLGAMNDLSGKSMNVLQRTPSIRGVRTLPPEEARRLEAEWNGVFTKLGVQQGQLKARRKDLAAQTPVQYYYNRLFTRLFPRLARAH